MKKLPENVRSNSREYRKYYPILQIIKLQNIFKYDLIKSIEIVSNSVNIYVLKSTLKFILDFFEISNISEISDISQREKFEFQREKFEFQRGESEKSENFKNFEDFYKFLKSKHSFRQIKRNLKTFTTKERYKEIYEKCRETTFKNNGYYSSFECQEVQNKVNLKKYIKKDINFIKNKKLFYRCVNFYGLYKACKLMTKKYSIYNYSKFLKKVWKSEYDLDLQEIIYKVNNQISKCEECNKEFLNRLKNKKFCSKKCAAIFNQRKMTDLEKEIRDNKLRFPKSEEFKNKIKESWKFRDIELMNQKIRQTKFEKYGDPNYNNSKQIGLTNSKKDKEEILNKMINTNLEKFGFPDFNCKHIKNFELLNKEYLKNNFIKDSKFLIEDAMEFFNLSNKTMMKYKKKFNIIETNKIKNLKDQTYLFDIINSNNKIFNDKSILNPREIDIFLPDSNLAIEYNGLMWHSQGISEYNMFHNPEKNLDHFYKMEICNKKGIQLFNIFEGEDLDLWLSMIHNKLGLNKRIFARKCIIKELESNEIKDFLNENHIQGYIPSRINLGLFYNFKNSSLEEDFELVQVMTFSKSRYTRDIEYELIRLCGLKGYSIIGGASKLLKYFETKYKPKSIVSFANRRFSNGDIYKKLGFDFVENTNPNYFYFKTGDTQLYSRVQFQKHKLKNKLEIFDPELSETDNMFNNGYRRIYDCGNMKFIKYLNY